MRCADEAAYGTDYCYVVWEWSVATHSANKRNGWGVGEPRRDSTLCPSALDRESDRWLIPADVQLRSCPGARVSGWLFGGSHGRGSSRTDDRSERENEMA